MVLIGTLTAKEGRGAHLSDCRQDTTLQESFVQALLCLWAFKRKNNNNKKNALRNARNGAAACEEKELTWTGRYIVHHNDRQVGPSEFLCGEIVTPGAALKYKRLGASSAQRERCLTAAVPWPYFCSASLWPNLDHLFDSRFVAFLDLYFSLFSFPALFSFSFPSNHKPLLPSPVGSARDPCSTNLKEEIER